MVTGNCIQDVPLVQYRAWSTQEPTVDNPPNWPKYWHNNVATRPSSCQPGLPHMLCHQIQPVSGLLQATCTHCTKGTVPSYSGRRCNPPRRTSVTKGRFLFGSLSLLPSPLPLHSFGPSSDQRYNQFKVWQDPCHCIMGRLVASSFLLTVSYAAAIAFLIYRGTHSCAKRPSC